MWVGTHSTQQNKNFVEFRGGENGFTVSLRLALYAALFGLLPLSWMTALTLYAMPQPRDL